MEWGALTVRGNISIEAAGFNTSMTVEGLDPLVSYKMYLVAEDEVLLSPNVQKKLTVLR